MKERTKLALKFEAVLIGIALIMPMIFLGSCTTTKVVTVEKVKTDTTYITQHQRDSIWLHDSIRVSDKGDTIRIERWHTKYIEKVSHDTTYVATHDTIPQPYPVIKEVEKKLSKPQKGLMGIGLLSLMGILLFIASKLKRFIP